MPRFDLATVQAAAEAGRIRTGGTTYRAKLLPYLATLTAMVDFTREVLLELSPADFLGSPIYGDTVFDAYGVAISDQLQARFSIEGLVTWYVKFAVDEDPDGEIVVMASLHEPKETLSRVGGALPVRFERTER